MSYYKRSLFSFTRELSSSRKRLCLIIAAIASGCVPRQIMPETYCPSCWVENMSQLCSSGDVLSMNSKSSRCSELICSGGCQGKRYTALSHGDRTSFLKTLNPSGLSLVPWMSIFSRFPNDDKAKTFPLSLFKPGVAGLILEIVPSG